MKWLHFFVFPIAFADCIMKGISIYGLETPLANTVCSWIHPVEYYIAKTQELGFNLLRLPFSLEYVDKNDFTIMDRFIAKAQELNMSVVLDCHRVINAYQGESPYHTGLTKEQFRDKWFKVLHRYKDYSVVIGHNIYNEFQPPDAKPLLEYSRYIIEEIEHEFGDRFLHYVTGTLWSGNLHDVSLEDMPCRDRIFYSVHKYPFSQPATEEGWNFSIPIELQPKIIIGEFGWKSDIPEQREWATRFLNYLAKRNITDTIYWTIAHSGDTGNLYQDDCEYIHYDNYQLLRDFWEQVETLPRTRFLRSCKK